MANLNLPAWLNWLGSPIVCTIITAIAVVQTIVSWILNRRNRTLRLQIQNIQGGPQQQGQGAQQKQQGGQGAQQAQQAIQQVTGDVYTINNYGPVTYTTETKGETGTEGEA
jgi:hypothetical protein